MSLRSLLTDDHKHCDDLFAAAEQAAGQDVAAAKAAFARFREAMLAHFTGEEEILFPAFEARTGMRMGPTQVMRSEHAQMRELMDDAVDLLAAGKSDDFLGQAETLLIMMQQHNMKEENVLYPMCDQHLAGDAEALGRQLRDTLQAA
ncbi:hemerythrin domain-containing protein [Azonexus sp. R2A61]|uniref:hemerythrin domain-containing protein n=1 Tax=Azonexus sp. R2A61 TaxID=2744443 RepID=UPI0034601C28